MGVLIKIEIKVNLYVIDYFGQGGYCKDDKRFCVLPAEVEIRVFDTNDPVFEGMWGENPDKEDYEDIFEFDIGRVSECITDPVTGKCVAAEENKGDYLVIAKYIIDSGIDLAIYSGQIKDINDFNNVGEAKKTLHILKLIRYDNSILYITSSQKIIYSD